MIEPSLAFQTAVRDRLVNDTGLTALVQASRVRTGPGRPDLFPSIVIGSGRTEFLGRASGGQLMARVGLQLHIWGADDVVDTPQAIGFAVLNALADAPSTGSEFSIDDYDPPAIAWMREPSPTGSTTHGAVALSAVLRWRQ